MKINLRAMLCFAVTAAAVWFGSGCATTTTTMTTTDSCCTPAGSQLLGQAHSARFGTNQVYYLTAGKGDHVIVLVHCWAGNLDFWREQIPALQDKARLVLIDLPGHGRSDKPHTIYTMDYFASAVVAVMRDAHVNKATLVGHSMGTPVICRVYQQAPERVAALVAVDGFLHRPALTAEQVHGLVDPFHNADYRNHTTNFITTLFPNPGTEALRGRVLAELLATPQFVMAGAMDGMFDLSQPDWDLKKVDVPVLVLNANNPTMWNDPYKNYVHELSSKTDYRTIEGAGHWLMMEKPAEFNTALIELLREFDLIAE
jgi:sigma-B regulation protein RsbQ